MPRYWWQEPVDEEAETFQLPRALPPPATPDPARLRTYRAGLTQKALLAKRGSARRTEIEKRLVKVTAELLRLELRGRR